MAQRLRIGSGDVHVVEDVSVAFSATVLQAFRGRAGERFSLVLSGGPTARRCYERLAADHGAAGDEGIRWELVDVLMGDERCVAPEDPDANQLLVREALIDRVEDIGAFHPMSCDDVAGYQTLLELAGRLDLVHLGMGPDGHTASLFPGSEALEAGRGVLALRTSDPSELNPHDRMTLSYEALSRADLVLFTVSGESKRDALAAVVAGADLPAARVRAKRVLWLVDPAAAGGI